MDDFQSTLFGLLMFPGLVSLSFFITITITRLIPKLFRSISNLFIVKRKQKKQLDESLTKVENKPTKKEEYNMSYADEVRELINKKKTEENDFVKEIKYYFEQKLTKEFLENVLRKSIKKDDLIVGSLKIKMVISNSFYEEMYKRFKISFKIRNKKIAYLKIPTKKYKYVDFDYVGVLVKLSLESLLKTRMEELGFVRTCSDQETEEDCVNSYYNFTW